MLAHSHAARSHQVSTLNCADSPNKSSLFHSMTCNELLSSLVPTTNSLTLQHRWILTLRASWLPWFVVMHVHHCASLTAAGRRPQADLSRRFQPCHHDPNRRLSHPQGTACEHYWCDIYKVNTSEHSALSDRSSILFHHHRATLQMPWCYMSTPCSLPDTLAHT